MGTDRAELPQLEERVYLTDGGLETTLVFLEGFELPDFAAFHLLRSAAGRQALERYFASYAGLAARYGCGCVLESATWRASADWGARLGYTPAELDAANREAVALLRSLRAARPEGGPPLVVSGCLGPRGDGYQPGRLMTADEAERYHARQVESLVEAGADLITGMTLNYTAEAIGMTRAIRAAGAPAVISLTVETDGRLPTGESLGEAIERVDAATDAAPAYYMLNCAHPAHFEAELLSGAAWVARVRGLRANASTKSHAELNDSTELDIGDPRDLGERFRALRQRLGRLTILGGCCGTDLRHLEAIAAACAGPA